MNRMAQPSYLQVGAEIRSERASVRYRVERVLGRGATATACLTRRIAPEGESPAVLKVILPKVAAESGAAARSLIQTEAVALGRLNERVPPTPYVVRLIDSGVMQVPFREGKVDLPWVALEYVDGGVEGTTLEERLDYTLRHGQHAFDPARCCRLLEQLASGLDEVHAAGVVHRDINANNVLCCGVDETEIFKLSDFGIARPFGLGNTLVGRSLGTPGYAAPEQVVPNDESVGAHSDIFSLGVLLYFVLTALDYFTPGSPVELLEQIRSDQRRSIRHSRCLCPELQENPLACAALDLAIKRATAFNIDQRYPCAREFATAALSWLAPLAAAARRGALRKSWSTTIERVAAPTEASLGQSWSLRHPSGDDRVISSAAWNAAGHCLAATPRGLSFWDGTSWADAPAQGLPMTRSIRLVRGLGAATWCVGGESAILAEFSKAGLRVLQRGPDHSVSFVSADGDLGDLVVLAAERHQEMFLYALVGSYWLKPLPVPEAAILTSVAQIDPQRCLVVGRDRAGGGYAAIYRPLEWELERIPLPSTRALVAASRNAARPYAIAVGADGVVLEVNGSSTRVTQVRGNPHLSACAIDSLGRAWVAGLAGLWVRDSERGWVLVWSSPEIRSPLVGLTAEVGLILGVTVDGAILECRMGA